MTLEVRRSSVLVTKNFYTHLNPYPLDTCTPLRSTTELSTLVYNLENKSEKLQSEPIPLIAGSVIHSCKNKESAPIIT
ncbi:unnamed protein product [Sphenostylis stenocarpa]|uniref:Uncharacterized protein n=1 Tax=Sphenostylis stenocarpa TaxID=92480 RepID=A0AA86V4U4_9FABA|nr:unnamed protein product [Sphenostylis stenocarpa]